MAIHRLSRPVLRLYGWRPVVVYSYASFVLAGMPTYFGAAVRPLPWGRLRRVDMLNSGFVSLPRWDVSGRWDDPVYDAAMLSPLSRFEIVLLLLRVLWRVLRA